MTEYRTHTCNELRPQHVGEKVVLSGWIHNHRDHGGVLFIDLRDHYGVTQLVIHPEASFQYELAHTQKETVIRVQGKVKMRSEETLNPKLDTGEVEVAIANYDVLSPCEPLPFAVFPEDQTSEELRLKYRFVDLRRSGMHDAIMLRSKVIASVRRRMWEMGFNEIQTPILTSSSPEGARDFLVPSRLHPGKFYALPQAPQQYKQLLMVGGFDRYFQIAPCFRDEDSRANRSPGEFYQIDIEMSFVTQEEIFEAVEKLFTGLFEEFSDWRMTPAPFPRIPYKEAMLKYGSDKPDLRIPIEIVDLTQTFAGSEFKSFSGPVAKGAIVRALPVRGISGQSRNFFDNMIAFAQSVGAKGLAYILWKDGEVKSPIAKFLSQEELNEIAERCRATEGDVVFFVCDDQKTAEKIAGSVREKLADELDLREEGVFSFCWVVDFPMYEKNEQTGAVEFSHNPFSMPQGGLEALESRDPLDILAYQYDIVCNGEELSSGAIRNHRPDIMFKAFEIAGYGKDQVMNKFGGMINALKLGAPPHGGIAPGLDRVVMLLAHKKNIREVTAFPMNQMAEDLMMNAPRSVSDEQLKELGLEVRVDE